MIPIYLDPQRTMVAVIGRGATAKRRVEWLRRLDAAPVVFSDAPTTELREAAGEALAEHLPERADLRNFDAIWIVDLDQSTMRTLAEAARAEGVLVNVEDVKSHCAFHTPAIVRRGKLVLAAGTGGASPAAASAVREKLEQTFDFGWAEALDELAVAREKLRASGADMAAIATDARARLRQRALIEAAK
ncbi:siroheme synthase [alpha proteobacterium U9-1i]|nr:siroheme synthase [alpha proteobacterium U9-1i]